MEVLQAEMARLAKELEAMRAGGDRPKLKQYRGSKFGGKKEEFEAFKITYEAAKVLDAHNFEGWSEANRIAYLVSAVEGEALKVVRAAVAFHKDTLTYNSVWKDLEAAFKDTAEGDRALAKLQTLMQKGDVEAYIREFNTLVGLASASAKLEQETILRHYIRGLKKDLRIMVAPTGPKTVAEAQVNIRSFELVLEGKGKDTTEAMDTNKGHEDRACFRRCNHCGLKGHIERFCRKKAALAGERTPQKDGQSKACYVCRKLGHFARNCQKRAGAQLNEASINDNNKDVSEYSCLQGEGGRVIKDVVVKKDPQHTPT